MYLEGYEHVIDVKLDLTIAAVHPVYVIATSIVMIQVHLNL